MQFKNLKQTANPALFIALVASTALFSACGKDDENTQPVEEQEVITTLRVNLMRQDTALVAASIVFRDLDGPGGQNPVITPDTLRLEPNYPYMAKLEVLDESNPANIKDLTQEIRTEGKQHQFFFTPSAGLNLTISDFDRDANQLPVGLEATFESGAASRGNVRIILSHYDETPKNGTTPSGETDIDVTFPVRIQP